MKNTLSRIPLIALSLMLIAGSSHQAQAGPVGKAVAAPVKVAGKTTEAATKPVAVAVKGTGGILKKVIKVATSPLKILTR